MPADSDIEDKPPLRTVPRPSGYYGQLGLHRDSKVDLLRTALQIVQENLGAEITVVDLGCADGAVLRRLRNELRSEGVEPAQLNLYGIDSEADAIQLARSQSADFEIRYAQTDLLDLGTLQQVLHSLTGGVIHLVLMSSVLHELPEPGSEHETLVALFQAVGSMIASGGCLVVRDPAKPVTPDARYMLALSKQLGPAQRMPEKVLPPRFAEISYSDLFSIFEAELFRSTADFPFRPQYNCRELAHTPDTRFVELSALMLREFLQKRTFCTDEILWQSEMKELNCRFNAKDLESYAQHAGVFTKVELATWRDPFHFVELRPNEGLMVYHMAEGPLPPAPEQMLSQEEHAQLFPSHVGGFLWRDAPLNSAANGHDQTTKHRVTVNGFSCVPQQLTHGSASELHGSTPADASTCLAPKKDHDI